jgi:hypothetical protein
MLELAPDFDFSRYLRVGEVASARPFVEADIPDPHIVSGWGHDGQANYVLSRVFPNLADAEGHLDSVTYRSRRIVYPVLTSWLPDGQPTLIGMWALNLIAIGVDRAVLFSTLNLGRVVPWVIPLAVLVLSRDRRAESADNSHARLHSADKDGLDRERHAMVEGFVDRTALRHL